MKTKLISITSPKIKDATVEDIIVYCARISNPENQTNFYSSEKLLRYLIENKHWSPFEMVNMCIEVETSNSIAKQILRHKSFSFAEFSQRYNSMTDIEAIEFRQQGVTNRQGGELIAELDKSIQNKIKTHINESVMLYNELINNNVARETARFILPMATKTRLYVNGSLRSWIHYLQQRLDKHSQKEHRLIALEILEIFKQNFPITYKAVFENE